MVFVKTLIILKRDYYDVHIFHLTKFIMLQKKYLQSLRTFGMVVILQVQMLVRCEGQVSGFKSSKGNFTHIYT